MESVNHLFVRSLFGNNFHFLFVVWKQKNPNKIILIAFFFIICFGGPIRNSDGYYILDDMRLDENQLNSLMEQANLELLMLIDGLME